ncbi:MAG: membrane protein insertion efficiency factor YidD [Clostridia bacterium]|nr:membrane protein insertion efficiency factor YidD [Oscillospiraceae bacterium]MBQ7960406.1 membrane protein insertion efficiency factor YidD [Clostridia bacterium]
MNKLLSFLLTKPIEFYRRFISPIKPPCCRFYPTCSEYALLAIRKHGPLKGFLKALWRILRCHPFSKGGIDMP